MQNLRRPRGLTRKRYFDDIEAEGPRLFPQLREVNPNRPAQHAFLSPIDRKVARHQRARVACLDFDEHQRFPIAADQIDFVAKILRTAPVSHDDGKVPLPPQPLRSEQLTAIAGASRLRPPDPALKKIKHDGSSMNAAHQSA